MQNPLEERIKETTIEKVDFKLDKYFMLDYVQLT